MTNDVGMIDCDGTQWTLTSKYRELRAEVERLREAQERMVKDGCGFAPRVCPERSPDPRDWCWSCHARAALQGEGK